MSRQNILLILSDRLRTDALGCYGSEIHPPNLAGHVNVPTGDTFFAFKSQLEAFIAYLRTGERPVPFAETVELMQLVIAGIRSRAEGGREVLLSEI